MATTYTQRSYKESEEAKLRRQQLKSQEASKPDAYASDWEQELEAAVAAFLNRQPFSYDPGSDPLYQQQKEDYVNLGRMAMMDTLGQASALTGGYGNSYAQLAGQQSYNASLQGLNDVLPELYQLALSTYDRQGQNLLDQYGVLADREAVDYDRYSDSMDHWADQRDYLASRYDAERGFDYSVFRDMVGDDQWLAAFDEDIRRYELSRQKKTSSGGGSSKSSSGGSTTKKKKEEEEKPTAGIYKLPVQTVSSQKKNNATMKL